MSRRRAVSPDSSRRPTREEAWLSARTERTVDIFCGPCRAAGVDRRLGRFHLSNVGRLQVTPWGLDGSGRPEFASPTTPPVTADEASFERYLELLAEQPKTVLRCSTCHHVVQLRPETIERALAAVARGGRVSLAL